jgi:phospholipid-binding lipoprotein MlaA
MVQEPVNCVMVRWCSVGLVTAVLALGGCATGPQAVAHDPLEPLNRGIYAFNDAVDTAVVKPVATAYRDAVPRPVRTGVHNFFNNLDDLWSSLNAALQAKPRAAAENFMRFNVNTFLGLAGLLDIATEMGIERTSLDFGHTLGHWGMPAGPYLVLPLFGPSSVRDAAGRVVDSAGDGLSLVVDHTATYNATQALRLTDKRAGLLRATEMLDQVALDKYSFTRDAYLQRRASLIRPDDERYDEEDFNDDPNDPNGAAPQN